MNLFGRTIRILSSSFLLLLILPQIALTYELESKVQAHTLTNGLRILLMKRQVSPTVSLYIRYKVGAVDEESGRTGTAHFLEHLLFKGTKTIGAKNYPYEKKLLQKITNVGGKLDGERRKNGNPDLIKRWEKNLAALQEEHKKIFLSNEIDRIYTENGGLDMNASTGQDVTTYHVSIPANKVELWARIESDRMRNAVFREFYQERDVVREERLQRIESDPDGKLYEQFLALAFTAHPYGKPILGWSSDIASFCPHYTRDFYRRFYSPNNTVITVVGDIDPQATLLLIRKYFGPIPRQEIKRPQITKEPPQRGERRAEVIFDAQPKLIIGFHKPTLPAFEDYVFDVIDYLLATGRSSRFYKNLVEGNGVATRISAVNGIPGARYNNLFTIFAEPRHPVTTQELEIKIYEELDRLKRELVPAEELKKVKNILQSEYIRGLNSNSGLASKLSYFETIAGDYRYITNHLNNIDKVTSESIMQTAQKYFVPDNRTVAVLRRGTKGQE